MTRGNAFIRRFQLTAIAALFAPLALAATPSTPALLGNVAPVAGAQHFLAQVKLDAASLNKAQRGQMFQLSLPTVGDFNVVFDGRIEQGKGMQWMGHLKDGLQYSVVLQMSAEGISGELRTPKGNFRLGQANDGQWLAQEGVAGNELAALPRLFQGLSQASTAQTQKPAKVAYPVRFDLASLAELPSGAEVALDIPGQGSHRVVYDTSRDNQSGSVTWVGYLKDYGSDFRVLITSDASGAVGNIFTPAGEFELTMNASGQWLVDRVASGLSHYKTSINDGIAPPNAKSSSGSTPTTITNGGFTLGGVAAGGVAAATTTTTGTTTGATATATTASNQADVMILYTAGFVNRNPTSWSLRLDQLVSLSNQAYIDSGINAALRLVYKTQVATADNTLNSTELSNLSSGSGNYSTVAALRTQYAADLVSLVRPFYMNAQGQNCGIAYIGGYGGTAISGYASSAFSVVSDGTDMEGSNYYCTDYTFTHELGHNMGSMHDRATVASQGGGTGAYPYSFGYGISGSFGTIMSYISPVVGKFSNPNVICAGTTPCGISETNTTSSANNALSINNTIAAVAAFKVPLSQTTYTLSGTVSTKKGKTTTYISGVSFNVTTSSATAAGTCGSSNTSGAYSCTVPYGWSGSIAPVQTGYTFTPTSKSYSNITANQANQNFTRN